MCGITGVSYHTRSGDAEAVLAAMSKRLIHRGPDDHGQFVLANGNAGVAHRRLSIIDLSAQARQPLFSEDGALALVCNGEIYNYQDLRQELEAKGHHFSSHSDSEVIMHLYEEIGANVVHKLKGMFAFAILDTLTGDLFCARDPLGKKPLFYGVSGRGVALASEIPALFEVPDIDLNMDADAIGLFLLRNVRHIPDPWTIYKGIRSLPPGHTMRIAKGRVAHVERYWRPSLSPQATSPDDVLEALDHAVDRRRMADVEIGALLSGGVDSTAIVDCLNRQGIKGIRTYAFGLNVDDEELVRARRASKMLGSRHQEIYFDADRQHDLFDKLLGIHGQPIMALPLTHAMMLFEAVQADGLKVVMAGHGADEVFYGYDGARSLASLSRLDDALPGSLMRPLASAMSHFFSTGRLGDALRVLSHTPGQRKTALYNFEARSLWPYLFQTPPDFNAVQAWSGPWFEETAPTSYIDEAAFLGLMQENAHAITIAGDLPAMAHGVEVRCPFMDQDLIELALTIPYADKVKRTRNFSGGKQILKCALRERLPEDILKAHKRGFGYFVQEEAVLRGPWKTRLDEAFLAPDDFGGLFNVDALHTLKSRFDQNSPDVPAILIAKLYALQRFQAGRGCT
ncbi:MAG: asparagine synthase (glutamine-hydrolyzing) [Rhodospirillales bacterium]|nr:asparagine synthase (glutamine-hydrolyzing) [Rhodospirillales bacterium]